MSSHMQIVSLASLGKDESVHVTMKNTFLCFKSSADTPKRHVRNRSFTEPAVFFDCSDRKPCESMTLEFCETAEGSSAGSETEIDSLSSEGEGSETEQSATLELKTTRRPGHKVQPKSCLEYTTIMLRNLPNNYSREMLVELLQTAGFRKRFDFVYVPIDFKKCAGLGYAFVNFVSNDDATRAMLVLEHFSDWKVPSQKVLHLSWSLPLQGLEANIERYRNSVVMHPNVPQQFKPLVFKNGLPASFPAPTRNIMMGSDSNIFEAFGCGQKPSVEPSVRTQAETKKQRLQTNPVRTANSEVAPEYHTTVMMRNLPNDYSRDMLIELLDSKGFRRRFDFVYVPVDFQKGSGLGYAFVNFVKREDAEDAMQSLESFDDWKVPSRKVLQLSWSMPLQGLTANIERYRNNSVMHPDVPDHFKPVVLKDGHPVPFPLPSRHIHPPHRRK